MQPVIPNQPTHSKNPLHYTHPTVIWCPSHPHCCKTTRHGEITVIPNNTERYTSFTIGDVTFIDSIQFMMSSLDNLAKNLKDDKLGEILRYLKCSYESMYRYDLILHQK